MPFYEFAVLCLNQRVGANRTDIHILPSVVGLLMMNLREPSERNSFFVDKKRAPHLHSVCLSLHASLIYFLDRYRQGSITNLWKAHERVFTYSAQSTGCAYMVITGVVHTVLTRGQTV